MIGVFDSGVGGLSVLIEVRRLLPTADVIYLADQSNAPYGERSLTEVKYLAEQCTAHLLNAGVTLIVVACNTASAAALHHLRKLHPHVQFVGMEPAIKPAAAVTRSGVVGVLATGATFQGELFASLVGRFGGSLEIVTRACVGWADLVESGQVSGPETGALVTTHLDPVLAHGVDTLVLGCTHYPFLQAAIADRAGTQVVVIDPAAAVARQVAAIYEGQSKTLIAGHLEIRTTGDPSRTSAIVTRLTGIDQPVIPVTWPNR